MSPEGYLEGQTAETFDWAAHLAQYDQRLLATPEGRRAICELDPLAFALIYLRHHLSSEATGNKITFADTHLDWFRRAREWATVALNVPKQERDAEIAPRSTGKTTAWFLLIPMWAAAFGHVRFVAAFSDSGDNAQEHLKTFRRELDTNQLLQRDFPELCRPMVRATERRKLADNLGMIHQANGFIFKAKGINTPTLGMKVGRLRPDLLLMDDIERGEENYSVAASRKRLSTVLDVVFPLNDFARVVLVGTTTISGGIVHTLVKSVTGEPSPPEWIGTENFRVHYHRPILTRDDGTERSFWPARWTLEHLQAIRHTASYAKNFLNMPVAGGGDYWELDDISTAKDLFHHLPPATKMALSIDPATTSGATSDFTGLAVIGLHPAMPDESGVSERRCSVQHAVGVKLPPKQLVEAVQAILARFPAITELVIETNNGGAFVVDPFADLGVRIVHKSQSVKKELRIARLAQRYKQGLVGQASGQTALEEQQVAYPAVLNDDVVDAVASGVEHFLTPSKPKRAYASF